MSVATDSQSQLRSMLHAALVGQSEPVFMIDDHVVPATSLWTAARSWTSAWRVAEVTAGDRIVLASGNTLTTIEAAIAAWWEGLCLVVCAPEQAQWAQSAFSARLAVVGSTRDCFEGSWHSETIGQPVIGAVLPRLAPPTEAAVIAPSGQGYVALSTTDVIDAVTHPLLAVAHNARVVGTMPWSTPGGLIVEVLGSIVRAAAVTVIAPGAEADLIDEAAVLVLDASHREESRDAGPSDAEHGLSRALRIARRRGRAVIFVERDHAIVTVSHRHCDRGVGFAP